MTNKKSDLSNHFKKAWMRFNSNLSALWVFSQEIANLAEQWDEQMIQQLAADIADLFGENPAEVEKEIREFTPSVSELEIQPDYRENASVREIIDAFQTGEFQRRALRWIGRNPDKGYKLLDILNDAFNQPPANGILLRRSALVSLVVYLELLVQDLFTIYYAGIMRNLAPDGIGLESTNMSSDVRRAMSGGWKDRIEFFNTLGINISALSDAMDDLLEITQRRNLIVHKDGIIDSNYLSRVPAQVIQAKGFATGWRLLISKSYLLHALEVSHYFGAGLHQLCWRAWGGDGTRAADSAFENFILFSLQHERYSMAIKLTELGDHFGMEKEFKQVNRVNHTIALRELGQESEVLECTARLKRSRPDWKIKIAIAILEGKNYEAQLQLNQAARKKNLKGANGINPNWPLFKPVKSETWFINAFKIDQSPPRQKRR